MAYASILRKSAFSLVPLAARAARVQRNHIAPISAALNRAFVPQNHSPSSFPRSRDFSTDLDLKKPRSDESLIQTIESEIQCAVESEDTDPVEYVPSGFPFKIEDEPGLQMIKLTREYDGETIKVEVHMPNLVTGEEDEDGDDDDNEKSNQSSIPLAVTVTKKSGLTLEFNCVAFPDEVSIESLPFRNSESDDQLGYEGPEFEELDENLQKAFHKYLEIRGIKSSTTNFLHEYMVNKDSREYLMWLKNLKKFVQE